MSAAKAPGGQPSPKKHLDTTAAPPPAAPLGLGGGGLTSVEAIAPTPIAEARSTVTPGSLVALTAVDTPPVTLSRKLPTYSLQARQMRIQGTVVLNVLVNEKGTVDQVEIITGVPGADVNDAAVKAAKQWTFRPAMMEGVPVKVWKTEQVAFKL